METDNTQKKIPADRNFIYTKTSSEGTIETKTLGTVAAKVEALLAEYSQGRDELERDWLDCWAHYFGNYRAETRLRQDAARLVGDVNDDWRHRVSTGKAFENVETICGYLQSAFFPNRKWFTLTPVSPGYSELVGVVQTYLQQMLEARRFKSYWDMFIRQAVVVGTSVLAMPWRVETAKEMRRVPVRVPVLNEHGVMVAEKTKMDVREEEKVILNAPDFEVIDMFDFFMDTCAIDPNNANVVRRMRKTRAEVMNLIDNGFYNYGSKYNVASCKGSRPAPDNSETNKDTIREIAGLEYKPDEMITVLEFWGDLELQDCTYHNVVVTVCGGQVLRFETNPYWYGKPFLVATYTPVNRQVYGLGALQPSLGLYHEMNILTNQRLDNLELQVDAMWTFMPDGATRKEDIFTKPGKVFEVSDHNAIQRIPTGDLNNISITYQESGFLEERIDKVTGTGAFIGVGAGRSGERVTATEVQAQRDAGGNRLASRHQHLEDTALIPVLMKLYKGAQQFVTDDTIVRMPTGVPGQFQFAAVGAHELVHDFHFAAQGATYIADKEFELQKWLAFMDTVGNNPLLSQMINWQMVLEKLVVKFGLEDADTLILPPAPPPMPQEAPEPEEDPMEEELKGMGGQAMVDMVKGKAGTGQLPAMLAQLFNEGVMGGKGNPNDPAVAMAAEQMMQSQGV